MQKVVEKENVLSLKISGMNTKSSVRQVSEGLWIVYYNSFIVSLTMELLTLI